MIFSLSPMPETTAVWVYSFQTTRWEHVGDRVRITGQQEESIFWQMDDRSAGVGEGQYGTDTKPSTLTGCAISQGAKQFSPAKARPRQAERGRLWLSWGYPALDEAVKRTGYKLQQQEDDWSSEWFVMVILLTYSCIVRWTTNYHGW